SLFPYGLLAFAAVPLVRGLVPRARTALLAQALATPFVGIYSYANFLVLGAPWWAVPLSYVWVLLYPWYGNQALSVSWVLRLALLVYELRPVMRERAWPWQPGAHSS